MREFTVYKGQRFYIQSNGRYFQSGRHNDAERLLHRRVWLDSHGEIPKGFQVHHRNGNWRDNSLENLELVEAGAHSSAHMLERMRDPAFRARAMAAHSKAIKEAPKWHRSPEGIAWHSKHGKKTWAERKPSPATCSFCNAPYQTFFKSRSRYCSNSCVQKAAYRRRNSK